MQSWVCACSSRSMFCASPWYVLSYLGSIYHKAYLGLLLLGLRIIIDRSTEHRPPCKFWMPTLLKRPGAEPGRQYLKEYSYVFSKIPFFQLTPTEKRCSIPFCSISNKEYFAQNIGSTPLNWRKAQSTKNVTIFVVWSACAGRPGLEYDSQSEFLSQSHPSQTFNKETRRRWI